MNLGRLTEDVSNVHLFTIINTHPVKLKGSPDAESVYIMGVNYNPNTKQYECFYSIRGKPSSMPYSSTLLFDGAISLHELVDYVLSYLGDIFESHEKNIYMEVIDCEDASFIERFTLWTKIKQTPN